MSRDGYGNAAVVTVVCMRAEFHLIVYAHNREALKTEGLAAPGRGAAVRASEACAVAPR